MREQVGDIEFEPVKDTDVVNLEHILPEEISDKWSHINEEMFESWSRRIGNLTLLKSKPNSILKDSPFKVKRQEYKDSKLQITKNIYDTTTDQTLWGINEINERQKRLAELAIKTWPLYPKKSA